MSQEYKLVPVIATEEMIKKVFCGTAVNMEEAQKQWSSAVMVAPVPPAGDVEVIHQYLCKGLYPRWERLADDEVADAKLQGFEVRELVDRAHVIRLQADAVRNQLADKIVQQQTDINALKRDVQNWGRKACEAADREAALQADLTKARELLKSGSSPNYAHCEAVLDFLAHQSAPAAKGSNGKCWSCHEPVTLAECQEADGECPHCRAEIQNAEELTP